MKRAVVAIAAVFLMAGVAWADPPQAEESDIDIKAQCPKTLMTDQNYCFRCHRAGDFGLKEQDPDEGREYPSGVEMKVRGTLAEMLLTYVDRREVAAFFDYIVRHKDIKEVVIKIFSPGGSLMDAADIAHQIKEMEAKGYVVSTQVDGFAASAGFFIFANGTKGHRIAGKYAMLMWHELITFEIFKLSSPSGKEDEAVVLRWLQSNVNTMLQECSKLTKEELDELTHKKEYWISGQDALEAGFADKIL